jgi:hypothetical protein
MERWEGEFVQLLTGINERLLSIENDNKNKKPFLVELEDTAFVADEVIGFHIGYSDGKKFLHIDYVYRGKLMSTNIALPYRESTKESVEKIKAIKEIMRKQIKGEEDKA